MKWSDHWIERVIYRAGSFVTDISRLQLKCDGTRWRTGGEVKGKLANAVGCQYSSHYLGTRCIQHYYRWCRTARLPAVYWTDAPTGRFKWTRPFIMSKGVDCSWNVMAHGDAQGGRGQLKGKLAIAVGSQYPSHYLGTRCIQHYYRWCRTPRLPAVFWTDAHRPI